MDDEDEAPLPAPAPEQPPPPLPPGPALPPQDHRRSNRIHNRIMRPDPSNVNPDKVQHWTSNLAIWTNTAAAYLAATHITPSGDPNTYEYAVTMPEAYLWQRAMEEELECLKSNNTWVLCDLPHGCKAIKCKWVYLTKRDTQGNITRHCARLVAKGFSQTAGVDYEETFAPVARLDSL